jgi:hypothetical protein
MSKPFKNSSLLRSIILAVPLAVLSLAAGFTAYRLLHPQQPDPSGVAGKEDPGQPQKADWPAVQTLSRSNHALLTTEQLSACKTALGLDNEKEALAHVSNFGERDPKDALGRMIPNTPALIVLHETVISSPATVNLFQTNHPNDNDQASYHMLVDKEGTLIRIVPDEKRAYGSGYSRFGDFTVHSKSPDNFSVNNVALHISLETPPDGRTDAPSHSGYSNQQYDSLAKQVLLWQAKYGIPIFRLTTHESVDRSHSRYDPRSFRWDSFDNYHRQHADTCGLDHLTLPQ